MSTAIIGAGLSGLCYAKQSREPTVIYEQNDHPGGLCVSHYNNWGVLTDVGPHIFFSKDKSLLNFFLRLTEMKKHKRMNHVLCKKRLVEYPFENYLGMLPSDDCLRCVQEFKKRPKYKTAPKTLDKLFLSLFGEGIYELYLKPYNQKLWKRPLSELSAKMGNRIPQPPMQHILDSAAGKYHTGFEHQANFYYPRFGGCFSVLGNLYSIVEKQSQILLNKRVLSLQIQKNGQIEIVFTSDRTTDAKRYDRVISTAPLPEIVHQILPKAPKKVLNAAQRLKYIGISVTAVHAAKCNIKNTFALTIPSSYACFHRMTSIDYFGTEYQVGTGSTILVETSHNEELEPFDAELTRKDVILGLHNLGLVPSIHVLDSAIRYFKYAYPVYTLTHTQDVTTIRDWLRTQQIIPLGRFGSFEYINMDKVYKQVKDELQ